MASLNSKQGLFLITLMTFIFSACNDLGKTNKENTSKKEQTTIVTESKSSWVPPTFEEAVAENTSKSDTKYKKFKTIHIQVRAKVAFLTINNPPVNLFNLNLVGEMNVAADLLSKDGDINVVVIQSADPEFFIAHSDVNLIVKKGETAPSETDTQSYFHNMTEKFRLMPKATIGKLDGIARGGGLELLSALDMRFCSLENTKVSQPEIGLGLIPGGGGSSRWPRIIGTGRAFELSLGGLDFDGALAERYGMVNRAMPQSELDEFVNELATRIASYPSESIRRIKELAYNEGPIKEVLKAEAVEISQSSRTEYAKKAMRKFLDDDSQSRENELKGLSVPEIQEN